MPAVLLLPTGKALTVRTAADAFLDSLANPNTVRNYGIAVGRSPSGSARPGRSPSAPPLSDRPVRRSRVKQVLTWLAECLLRHDIPLCAPASPYGGSRGGGGAGAHRERGCFANHPFGRRQPRRWPSDPPGPAGAGRRRGATGGVWECPDLFPLPIDGSPNTPTGFWPSAPPVAGSLVIGTVSGVGDQLSAAGGPGWIGWRWSWAWAWAWARSRGARCRSGRFRPRR